MASTNSAVTRPDGTIDFSGGVNSVKVTTVQSETNPNGLARNEQAWLINATVRDGGIQQRWGWQPKGMSHDGSALFQGAYFYEPEGANPYIVASIGGHIYRIDPDTGVATDLTAMFPANSPQYNPATEPYAYFVQAEMFLIIQAGDGVTLPFFWDGTTLRRSIGITDPTPTLGANGVNEIPAATAMDYYMGRLWYAQGRAYSAGDIVGGNSGTPAYNYRDSVLNITENPLAYGGDGFVVPTSAGNIRALKHGANLDSALGEGRLFIFTREVVYSLQVPVTRTAWINAGAATAAGPDNQPLQTLVQLVNGSVNDRSIVPVNGDLFYQSLEPGIRSLISALRYFNQWGNTQISANEQRVLQFNDRSLMQYSSGIQFDNRLWETQLPEQVASGVVSKAVAVMDFVPISSFNVQRAPVWEGIYEGLRFYQLLKADFGGLDRAFGLVHSTTDGSINLWEFEYGNRFENGDNRVQWVVESPAFNWGNPFELKKLVSAELWIDRLFGTVLFQVDWRPDGCCDWFTWSKWTECTCRNPSEQVGGSAPEPGYPSTEYGVCYSASLVLPQPPENCAPCGVNRPAHIAYQFQVRISFKGYCRLRGLLLHASPFDKKLYGGIVC